MVRHAVTQITHQIRLGLDLLDGRLSRLGRVGSTVALTTLVVMVGTPLHVLVRVSQGLAVWPISILNIALEMAVIASPIIFYARDVIGELKASKTQLNEMSRRLAISVEEAQHANRAKSAFLANMSHELRTPLNAIMGFSEVMKDEHLGPVQNMRYLGYAGDIHASGRYLLGIINDILDLSKIEAGKMSLDCAEEFPLCQALEGSLVLVAPLAAKFDVALVCDMPQQAVRVVAVERMVRQILINLLGNAIKFTPAGGAVQVSGTALECGGYALSVRDTGVGMTAHDIERALQPFGQIENRMTAKHSGTGLGLPLAKAMLELHGGTLQISSMPNIGTTIVLVFPAERVCSNRSAAAA